MGLPCKDIVKCFWKMYDNSITSNVAIREQITEVHIWCEGCLSEVATYAIGCPACGLTLRKMKYIHYSYRSNLAHKTGKSKFPMDKCPMKYDSDCLVDGHRIEGSLSAMRIESTQAEIDEEFRLWNETLRVPSLSDPKGG